MSSSFGWTWRSFQIAYVCLCLLSQYYGHQFIVIHQKTQHSNTDKLVTILILWIWYDSGSCIWGSSAVIIKAQLFFHEQDLLILLDPCPSFHWTKYFFYCGMKCLIIQFL
jgi:hypothetical protein